MASKKKAIEVAVGSAFAAGMALGSMANAADNPFALKSLQSGYMVAEAKTAAEAKCGQGKCGGAMTAAPKSGEAVCGMSGMDANKDGKVSKGEFLKAHEAMFRAMDANKNGFLEGNELPSGAPVAPGAPKASEAKCGQGKCGAMPKK